MDNDYFCVIWVKETPVRPSVVERSQIVDNSIRLLSCDELLNQEVAFKWDRKNPNCIGKVLHHGSKAEMTVKSDAWLIASTNPAPKPTTKPTPKAAQKPGEKKSNLAIVPRKRSATTNAVVLAKKSSIDSVIARINAQDEKDSEIRNLKEELKLEREKRAALEVTCKDLKDKLENSTSASLVDVGSGIMMERAVINNFKSASPRAKIFARNMFRHLFKPHEVVGYTLMGLGCNVKKGPKPPMIDPVRRDAIIEYSLSVFNMRPGDQHYDLAVTSVKKTLTCLIVEMTREHKELSIQADDAEEADPPAEN